MCLLMRCAGVVVFAAAVFACSGPAELPRGAPGAEVPAAAASDGAEAAARRAADAGPGAGEAGTIGAAPSGVPLPEPGPARAADEPVSPQASGPTTAPAPAPAVATTLPAGTGVLPPGTAAPQTAEAAPADTADDSADAADGSGPDQATAAAPTGTTAAPAVEASEASGDVSAESAAGCRRVDPFAEAGGGDTQGVHALGFSGLDGSPGSLSGYAGCALVVNFFASWCAPCVAEMPDFEEFWRLHGDRVAVLGLARRDAVEDSARMVADTGVTYPVGTDSAALFEVFDGLGMPTTVFVSPDGAVADVYSGLMTPDLIVEFAERHFGPLG